MPSTPAALSPLHPHPRLFVRWFVQYNPTFTASALCVLGGAGLLLSAARLRQAYQRDPHGLIIVCMCSAAAAVAGIAPLGWASKTMAQQRP